MDAPLKKPRGRPPKPAKAAAEKLYDAADQAGGPMETLDNVPLASTSKRTSRRHTGSAASNDNKSSISMDSAAKTKERSKRSAAESAFEETNSIAPPRKRGRPLKGDNVSNSKNHKEHTSTDEQAIDVSADTESSDDDDSELIAKMLVRRKPTISSSNPSKDNRKPAHLDSTTDMISNMKDSTLGFPVPRVNDRYETSQEFENHVKAFAEKTGHKAYSLGGQGKYLCRLVCRNWKKTEYKPPGLGCNFHYLACTTESSGSWTIVSADPNHNAACIEREGSLESAKLGRGTAMEPKKSKMQTASAESIKPLRAAASSSGRATRSSSRIKA